MHESQRFFIVKTKHFTKKKHKRRPRNLKNKQKKNYQNKCKITLLYTYILIAKIKIFYPSRDRTGKTVEVWQNWNNDRFFVMVGWRRDTKLQNSTEIGIFFSAVCNRRRRSQNFPWQFLEILGRFFFLIWADFRDGCQFFLVFYTARKKIARFINFVKPTTQLIVK